MANKEGDGKIAEGRFTEHLKELMKNPLFWGHRFPDAGVCMGRIPAQPADYIVMYNGASMLIECKESKSETSIPASRFTQLPKMTRFVMAGGKAGFCIFFRYAKNPYWIFVSLEDAKAVDKSLKITDEYKQYPDIKELMLDVKEELSENKE